MIRLAALIVLSFSLASFAEGTLGYSFRTDQGFWRHDIQEVEAVRKGVVGFPGGRFPTRTFFEDNTLHMFITDSVHAYLEKTYEDDTKTSLVGEMWGLPTKVEVVKDLETGNILLQATVGTKMTFKHKTKIDKKGKRSAEFSWTDKAANQVTGYLDIVFPTNKPGTCNGKVRLSGGQQVAVFACKSEGKLKDVFFDSYVDIIAYIAHMILSPDEKPK